jgi:hypothetical protein
MAFQKSYTDENENVYPESYWRVVAIEGIDFQVKVCALRVAGYKDKAHRDANTPMIAVRRYTISDADFDKYFSDNGNNIRALAYKAIQEIQDVLVTPEIPPTQEVRDDQGNIVTPAQPGHPAVFESFFKNAAVV